MRRILLVFLSISFYASTAQTVSDGLMMPKKIFCGGLMYTHDQWSTYWVGDQKNRNPNIGSIQTQSVMFMGTYGLTDNTNIVVAVPYIWTKATGGYLTGMQGVQDLSLTVKRRLLRKETETGVLNFFGAFTLSAPLSRYSPNFFPLSIGTATTRLSYRATGNYAFKNGIYINGSAAYTWRSNVYGDAPAYYTKNQLYLTDEIAMPNVFDFIVDVGYHKNAFQGEVYYTEQNTLGGGDIRSDIDMPLVSNRMNFSKVGGLVMYYLPWPKNFAVRGQASYVLKGRNVGQATTLTAGFLYTIYFKKDK